LGSTVGFILVMCVSIFATLFVPVFVYVSVFAFEAALDLRLSLRHILHDFACFQRRCSCREHAQFMSVCVYVQRNNCWFQILEQPFTLSWPVLTCCFSKTDIGYSRLSQFVAAASFEHWTN
jgi:hypothetical protein